MPASGTARRAGARDVIPIGASYAVRRAHPMARAEGGAFMGADKRAEFLDSGSIPVIC